MDDECNQMLNLCKQYINDDQGFEFYPFKVKWYNENVVSNFRLEYPEDALSIVVLSKPSMFEKTFLPWLAENQDRLPQIKDLIDECMQEFFDKVQQKLPNPQSIHVLHDFDMWPAFRRPKILMTTAGHVAGAAYYYQMPNGHQAAPPSSEDSNTQKKFLGLSIHPLYGGWFAFRCCIIFDSMLVPHLQQKEPENVLKTEESVVDLLKLFNYHWQDYRYRDCVPVVDRYSDRQRQYFSCKPSERRNLVEKWLQDGEL